MDVPETLFYPATMRFCVNPVIPCECLVMLDLECDPPRLIFERPDTATTGQIDERLATAAELAAIEAWVNTLPAE
jgi:hypothetical protein